jgi:uncharacterized protein (DUF2252 family)
MHDVVAAIRAHNAGRDPERLALKYRKLRADPFAFLRGTCHLFYDRLPADKLFRRAPPAWSCGDLHLENFGSYKGDNRLVYFDINDFDEAALAPASWDPLRLLASVLVASTTLRTTAVEGRELCKTLLRAYAETLASGKPRWIERDIAPGLVRDLLQTLKTRTRVDHLDRRTDRKRRRRTIRCDGRHALAASELERAHATRLVEQFAATQPDPAFFEVLDVARRIAGTGSLGVERYVVLVEGKGSPDANYLLDLKASQPSSLIPHLKIVQPRWASEAHRIVAVQTRMQAIAMAFLHPLAERKVSYVLRGLQPSEDRVALAAPGTTAREVDVLLQEMGRMLAWAQLRSAARDGSATADELIAFGAAREDWQKTLLRGAGDCAAQVVADWKVYVAAYDGGAFADPNR